jgi:hypothetical protein
MKKLSLIFLFLLYGMDLSAQNPSVQLVDAFPSLSFTKPVHLTNSNDATNRIFVVQQNGFIKVFPNDSNVSAMNLKTFLDISNKISSSAGEEGLLGLAFHPFYSSNGYFYVNYTAANPLRTVISRFKVISNNPDKADSLSEYKILEINQPYSNHNGGTLMFGLDGYLYIGMGDGGSGGDPQNNAQNLQSLLGKMLRININDTTALNRYVIPTSNPFYNNPAQGMEELFTWGMRNPWKYSQDPVTGLIYAGDVGQNIWEEIDIIQNGKNYGWRIMEGFACYNPATGCDTSGITLPIKVYNHSAGDCSIIGGYVYRGNRRPDLYGAYIYADYCTGKVWMLRYNNGLVTSDSLLIDSPYSISSFGVDQFNELYILGIGNGKIYRFNKNLITSEGNNQNLVPQNFNLLQNYPNPFNPSTTIGYNLPHISNVRLIISDITGKIIREIINTTQIAGEYKIIWDGKDKNNNNLSSGVYFYSLIAGNFKSTKQMLLVK